MQPTSGGSPYRYTPVTEDLVKLSAEIEKLSGRSLDGNESTGAADVTALVGVSHVACRICGKREEHEEEKEEEVVALRGQRAMVGGRSGMKAADMDVVAIRDPRAPSTATVEDAVRRYKVTRAFSPWTSQEKVYEDQGRHVADWVWRGFNATLISFGQQGTGKSYTLYNDGVSLSFPQERSLVGENDVDESCGLLMRILADLFSRMEKERREDGEAESKYAVGLSCWEILGSKTVDLLKPFSAYASPSRSERGRERESQGSDYGTIGISSLSEARACLNHARASSTNWYVDPTTRSLRTLPNRSHAFVRVVVFDRVRRTMAHLHVVDLCGSQSLATAAREGSLGKSFFRQSPSAGDGRGVVPRDMLSEHERERKGVNQQLLAFSRLVGEIAQQSDDREFTGSGAGAGEAHLSAVHLSARETKLTRELAPLLADDSRCFLLCSVSRSSSDYIDTANTLRVATRFVRISNACSKRVLSVDPQRFAFQDLSSILSVQEHSDPLSASHAEQASEDEFLGGSPLKVPKDMPRTRDFHRAAESPNQKSKSAAEVIHLTLSQVENIEQAANEIMETTKRVDRAMEASPIASRGLQRAEHGKQAGSSGPANSPGESEEQAEDEGSYYSSAFPKRQVPTYQDPILSGAVKFIHSSSSSSSSGGTYGGRSYDGRSRNDVGDHGEEHSSRAERTSEGYSYGSGASQFLNNAAKEAALQRLRELQGAERGADGIGLGLHSPVTSDETTDHRSKFGGASFPETSPSVSVVSSVKSVETQRKLDSLKQNFRSMYTELELPSEAIEDEGGESSNENEEHFEVGNEEEEDLPHARAKEMEKEGLRKTPSHGTVRDASISNARSETHFDFATGLGGQGEGKGGPAPGPAPGRSSMGLYGGRYEFEQDLGLDSGGDELKDEGQRQSSPSQSKRDYAELERAYDSLLKMIEREREAHVASQQKVKLLERDLLESQHTLSAQVDGQKLENVHLRSRCRQLEELVGFSPEVQDLSEIYQEFDQGDGKNTGLLGEIFVQLESEVDRVNEENALLREDLKNAHLSHAETVTLMHQKMSDLKDSTDSDLDSEEGEGAENEMDSDKEGDDAIGEKLDDETRDVLRAYRREQKELLSRHQKNKIQSLCKRLKKVEDELQEAKAEVAGYRKKDRKYAIQKRGVEDTIKRVGQLQRQLESKSQELIKCQLKFAESEGKCYTLSEEHAKMVQSVQKMQDKVDHSETVKRKYAEQLSWARKQVNRDEILRSLPPLPSGATEMDSHRLNSLATRKIQSAAGEICRRIRREPGLSPRVENMLDRLMQEVGLHVQERVVLARREALLLQMITGEHRAGLRRR
ncbi:kinesin-like protein [Chloropicon primus]|uniref:Kinesin-like protein n=2 Tax=Chloropicon primus TaxID=1764295 RepID=A0A5B8MSH0_9CHLO|nr:kinesin-like protein [Chloropicon primus]|eukprot:QDZ22292.1 kinesin-like protein [Chloropicon primus]